MPAPYRYGLARFWRSLESLEPPHLFGVDPPKARIDAVRIIDVSASNARPKFADVFARTHPAFLEQ
jgi:hypothetical protein